MPGRSDHSAGPMRDSTNNNPQYPATMKSTLFDGSEQELPSQALDRVMAGAAGFHIAAGAHLLTPLPFTPPPHIAPMDCDYSFRGCERLVGVWHVSRREMDANTPEARLARRDRLRSAKTFLRSVLVVECEAGDVTEFKFLKPKLPSLATAEKLGDISHFLGQIHGVDCVQVYGRDAAAIFISSYLYDEFMVAHRNLQALTKGGE